MRFARLILDLWTPPALAFGGGHAPSPPDIPAPPPPPPMLQSPQGEAAALDVRRRALGAKGYGSTIVTGPMGDTTAPDLFKPKLGG